MGEGFHVYARVYHSVVVNYKYRGTCTTVDGRKRYGETDGKRERERKAELTFTIDIEIGRVISLKYYD